MKLRNFSWLLLIILLSISFTKMKEISSLNIFSIQTSKFVLSDQQVKNPIHVEKKIKSSLIFSRYKWLDQLISKKDSYIENQSNELEVFITLSPIYMHMIKNIYPTSRDLAEMAVYSYPEDTVPLYWLLDSKEDETIEDKKLIFEKILLLNPKDGVAWRHLGLIYIAEKNTLSAIDAHINSCYNGDPGSNGCYNAGRLFEQDGRYEEALYYYRLSHWQPSQEAADRLEAKLSLQNP